MKNQRSINLKAILISFVFLIVTFHFSFFIFHFDKAEASALSLSIDPSIIVINAIPPTAVTNSISIQNKSDTQITLQIQLKPFKAKGENARPPASSAADEVGRGELEYLNSQDSFIAQNVQILDSGVPVEGIVLGPRQQKNLTLNINISTRPPTSSAAGEVGRDYYFSIIFVSQNTSIPTSSSSLNQIGIATNVLLSVGPLEIPKAIIEEFSSNIFFEKGPVPFTIRIKNEGVHFIRPMGEITIKNMFGQSVGKLDLPAINILSNSTRAIPNSLWNESFLLGFYTARLNILMSDEGPTFTRTIHFLAFPFQTLIIIAVMAIAAIVVRNRLKLYMNKNRTSV